MLFEKLNGFGHGFFGVNGDDMFGHEVSDQHLAASLIAAMGV
jgi:hypothetical protein